MEFLDFSLEILRRLPSRKVNWKYLYEPYLVNHRNTTEETNAIINGLEIARGFAALGYSSDGKTKKEILKLLNYACFGSKSTSKNLEECYQKIQTFIDARNLNCKNNKHAIRMFFEQRDVTPFDNEIIQKLDEKFLEEIIPVGNPTNTAAADPAVSGGGNPAAGGDPTASTENNQPAPAPAPEGVPPNIVVNPRHVLHECNFVCDPSGKVTKSKIDAEICNATNQTIKKVIRTDLLPNWRARFLLAVASDENFEIRNLSQPESKIGYFFDSFDEGNKSWCSYVKVKISIRSFETASSNCSVFEIATTNENETLIILMPKTEKLSSQFLQKLTAAKIFKFIEKLTGDFEEKEVIIPKLAIPGSFGLRSILNQKTSFFSSLFKSADPLGIPRIFCPFKAEFSKIIGKPIEPCLIFPLFEFYCKFRCYMKFERLEDPVNPNPDQPQDGNAARQNEQAEEGPQVPLQPQHVPNESAPAALNPDDPAPSVPPNNNSVRARAAAQALINSGTPSNSQPDLNKSIYNPPTFNPLANFKHSVTIEDEISGSFKHDPEKHPRIFEENDLPEYRLEADITLTQPFLFMIVSNLTIDNEVIRFPKFIGRFTNVEETFHESWTKKNNK